jgi:hypothetical protein
LAQLKAEVNRRWPMTSLLDVMKETDLRTGFINVFKSLGTRETLNRATLQPRLLLCLYGLGTNAGVKRMVSSNPNLTYRELLYICHRFIEKNALREAIRRVVNATFAERLTHIVPARVIRTSDNSRPAILCNKGMGNVWIIMTTPISGEKGQRFALQMARNLVPGIKI